MGTIRKGDTGLFSITRSPKSGVIHMVTKIRESSHFSIKSPLMDFVVAEKSEVQVHHLVFNEMQLLSIAFSRKFAKSTENSGDFPSIP